MQCFKSPILFATLICLFLFQNCSNPPTKDKNGTTDEMEQELQQQLSDIQEFMTAMDANVNLRTERKQLNDSEYVNLIYEEDKLIKLEHYKDLPEKTEINSYYMADGNVVFAGYFTADKDCQGGDSYCLSEERYYFENGKLIDSGQRSRVIAKSDVPPGSETDLKPLMKTVDFTKMDSEVTGDYFEEATNEVRYLKLRGESADNGEEDSNKQGEKQNADKRSSTGDKKQSSDKGSTTTDNKPTETKKSEPKGQPFDFNARGEAQIDGRVKGNRTFMYNFQAEQGQTVNLKLNQLKGPGHFKVMTRGAEIYNSYKAGSTNWEKTLARKGDYLVTVYIPEELKETEGDDARYRINISLQ